MESSVLRFSDKLPITVEKAKGAYLYDQSGKKYLDLTSGISTTNLGHCNDYIVSKLTEQAHKLWHCSNLFTSKIQEETAKKLLDRVPFADKIFFCSSGLEATEAAIKFIRKYSQQNGKRKKILSLKNGFHGRSITALSFAGSEVARSGFEPLLEGFEQISLNNIEELHEKVTDETSAIVLELIQSEGGIYKVSQEYIDELVKLRQSTGLLICVDEIQTGFGRIGKLFHCENLKLVPDIITCAKGMGNGFPVGGCIVTKKIADSLPLGTHGGTYSGNAQAMAVVSSVLDLLDDDRFSHVNSLSEYLMQKLQHIQMSLNDKIIDVRGQGMLLGLELDPSIDTWKVMTALILKGVAVTRTSNKSVLRILPPLIITKEEIDFALEVIQSVLADL